MNPVIEIFAGDQTGIDRSEYRDRMESLRSPDSIPAVQDLRLDALGNVWLETYQPPGASPRETARERGINVETGPSPWIVLDPEGRLLGTVLTPIGLRVFEIGDDYVLGVWIDSLGVEHVRRHRLVKN